MRSITEICRAIDRARKAYDQSLVKLGSSAPAVDAIETTLGWDTIFQKSSALYRRRVAYGACNGVAT